VNTVLDNLDVYVEGFRTTVSLTLLAAMGALVLGTLIAAMRVSPVPPLRWAATTYVELVRNTPLTVVFFIVVFGLPQVDIGTNTTQLPFFRFAVIALTVYTAAFVAEAVRSGINSVPTGQAEASRSIGMSFLKTLRLVVLPQAFANIIPPLASVFIALLKNTSIAAVFGVAEALQRTQFLINRNGDQVLWLLAGTAFGYVVLALTASAAFRLLERAVQPVSR
jgi:glutamate transport system permease protein